MMTPISQWVDEYLAFRRGLGFALETQGLFLVSFARYAEQIGHEGSLTIELMVNWALASRSSDPAQAVRRLSVVRQFARHRAVCDSTTEIPPVGLLGNVPRRKQPHIYSEAEISVLLEQTHLLHPCGGLRPRTYAVFFSLMLSSGLRLSEACHLTPDDVDLSTGILTVRQGKFRKSRQLPLHSTTTRALKRYVAFRNVRCRALDSGGFFRTDRAPTLTRSSVEATFNLLKRRLGWTAEGRSRRPRIHDLRHTFAVRRLLRWYQEGADVDQKLLALSTYLGHTRVTDTYWYLSTVPELMAITAKRFEAFARHEPEDTP